MQHKEQHPYKTWIDLAAARLGAQTLECSDDFFAEMENLLKPAAPVFIDDKYTDRGKWMDGWESRRKRVLGHDWCVIKLGAKGIIHGMNVCTRHSVSPASMRSPSTTTTFCFGFRHNRFNLNTVNRNLRDAFTAHQKARAGNSGFGSNLTAGRRDGINGCSRHVIEAVSGSDCRTSRRGKHHVARDSAAWLCNHRH